MWGNGSLVLEKLEHEGLTGSPAQLASANFDGVAVYDVTGAYSGSARAWELVGNVQTPTLISIEKIVALDVQSFTLKCSGKLRIGNITTLVGQAGGKVEVGNGANVVTVPAGQIVTLTKSGDDPVENTLYQWE